MFSLHSFLVTLLLASLGLICIICAYTATFHRWMLFRIINVVIAVLALSAFMGVLFAARGV